MDNLILFSIYIDLYTKLNHTTVFNFFTLIFKEHNHKPFIFAVEKLGPGDLLESWKGRGQRDPQITEALIRSKLEDKDSDEIATTSCKVGGLQSLLYTLLTRMKLLVILLLFFLSLSLF